ncbi:MAG TPA: LysR family transcriptional regulator [Aliiroseovarius sp.]|nr:LysR family transcriptional regulator [Aliiroseovarius sp.]
MPRQSQLKAFHHVALHGGFSRAADAMNLTQPAISEQVRKLEQEHDVLLFHRHRKRVTLTPAGEKLFLLTRHYFEVAEQIREYLSETRAAPAGTLRIIVDSAFHITDILARFRTRFPKVRIHLSTGNSETVLAALRAYDAEIGVVGSGVPGRDMDVIDLGSSDIVAVIARTSLEGQAPEAIPFRDLAHKTLVFREPGSKTRAKLEQAAEKAGIRLTPSIVAQGREAMREIVASGAGIGFVSRAEFGNDDRLAAIPISGADLEMGESLICLKQRNDVRLIRSFLGLAAAQTT